MSESANELPEIYSPLRKYKDTSIFHFCEIEEIEKMEIRDDDIWVLSYPRSGTTLTQEIVYAIQTDLDFETVSKVPLDARFPFLDLCLKGMPHFAGIKYIESAPSPRLIKSHLHRHVLPEQLFEKRCKLIYVMRNPKDVVVSVMNLIKFLKQIDPDHSTADFLEDWLNGETYSGPWWRHVRDFWQHRHTDNILILTYEDIVKNMAENIKIIGEFLGRSLTQDQIEQIQSHCQFDRMQSRASSNAEWMKDVRKVDTRFGGHIRRGKVGGWRDFLTQEMSDKVDTMVTEKLGDLDIKFDYDS